MSQQAARRGQDLLEAEKRSLAEVTSQDSALFQLLGKSLAPYKGWLAMALLLMLATSALNAVPPYLLQQAIDGPIANGETAALWRITAIYGATAFGIFFFTFGFTYFLQQAGQRALADLRSRLFNHILGQDSGFLTGTSTGELVARLTSDIDTLNAVLSTSIVTILVEGVTLIVIVVVMFMVNWKLAILSLAVLPLVFLVTRYFRKRIRRSSSGERSALALISSFLNEHIHGMTVVQLFNREDESEQEFDTYNSRYRDALITLRYHSAVFLAVQEILAAIALGLILYGGGQGVLAGWATLGTLVAFVQYTERAFQPVLRLSQQYNAVQIALGAAERIHQMLITSPVIESPEEPKALPEPIRGEIQFDDVHFFYLPDEPVLRGVDLHISPGQSVAIVGATGAGKSSLVGLLARQYDPTQGEVLLDGVNIRDVDLDELRRAVAVVPQDPICLEGSIRFNIDLYDDLPAEQIEQAAEFSNAAQFIEELPNTYDFKVLAGGANLSQGQRQLLSLARALALCPDGILILDEATSSIDTATEALIQDALERILRSRTSLVIAHRLSTVRGADRIIVMDRGRVVEDGNHESLLAKGGYYAELHKHQLMSEGEVTPAPA